MPTAIVDGHEIQLAEGERLNGIELAARAGIEIPHYCWHPGLTVVGSCRMCPDRNRHARSQDRGNDDAPQARARLQYAGPRRDDRDHQQRKSRPGQGDGRGRAAAAPSHRLPDLRQGRGMPPPGLSLPVRPGPAAGRRPPLHQPAPGRRRRRHVVRRPLRDVQPMRPLLPRDQRHRRIDGHRPRQPRGDSTSCPASR